MKTGQAIALTAAGVAVVGAVVMGTTAPGDVIVSGSAGAGTAAAGAGSAAPVDCVLTGGTGGTAGLAGEKVDNAKTIIAEAGKAGVGTPGARIGIATSLVESELKNLNYGDRDSLGLFQQRPSQGWGTPEQVTNPSYAAAKFYDALKKVDGWQSMDPGAAAQKVQASAFPTRYAGRMAEATQIVAALGGGTTGCTTAGTAAPAITAEKLKPMMAWAASKNGLRYVMGANGPNAYDCSSFTQTAYKMVGVNMPRTAEAQRQWCASGKCSKIPLGQEQPGDLIFWNSYLGTGEAGHVVMVYDPKGQRTIEARSSKDGVGFFTYTQQASGNKAIFDIYRPKAAS